ncbi:hypothetical protein [Aurantimonas marina]|uniref:hypothetical protein n=1 Tax=Aurantimonas marina TaxID=2780508 RepID=UPI001E2E13C6|nr:hypothetical protein [Aurantimonas marina]
MSVCISATDWQEGGINEADSVAISKVSAEAGCDLIDVSAGQTLSGQKPVWPHVPGPVRRGDPQRAETGGDGLGAITEPAQVNTILHTRRADLVALGRPHLWHPYFTREAAAWYDTHNQHWLKRYLAGRDQAHREFAKKREQDIETRRRQDRARVIPATLRHHGIGARRRSRGGRCFNKGAIP